MLTIVYREKTKLSTQDQKLVRLIDVNGVGTWRQDLLNALNIALAIDDADPKMLKKDRQRMRDLAVSLGTQEAANYTKGDDN